MFVWGEVGSSPDVAGRLPSPPPPSRLGETRPHPTSLCDNEGLREPRPEPGYDLQDRGRELGTLGGSEAHEDHPDLALPAGQDKLSEVLVLREEHAPVLKRESHDPFIGRSAGDLGNGDDIVTMGAERADDCEIATLVGQELQSQ